MDNLEIVDSDEKYFQIREDFELMYTNDYFYAMTADDYIVFKSIDIFQKVSDDVYQAKQEEYTITINQEEYEMITAAIYICKGNNL